MEVDVQAEDNSLSKILLVGYKSSPDSEQKSLTELTGSEQIALRGQELKQGEPVSASLKGW